MAFEISVLLNTSLSEGVLSEVVAANEKIGRFGLVISPEQALEISKARSVALKNSGRVEFGADIIKRIILEFCDSPYIDKSNFSDIVCELVDIFYHYKNETLDNISDDELIHFMKKCFDGPCHGSTELLSDRELFRLSQNIKFGHDGYCEEEEEQEEEQDEIYDEDGRDYD